jgi:U3 small nucleolar RNA-associated protein MPP10
MLFQDPDALVDDKDIENANGIVVKLILDIRYEDFFGSAKKPCLPVRNPMEKELSESERFSELENDEEEALVTHHSLGLEDDSESEDQVPKSRFEKQQEKLKKVISELEAEAVAEKDWALKGEVDASKRPKNSLLEHTLDVDYASKPVPVVTEETTATLEDIIKQRIKDELWDDVVRKVVVPEREFDPNKVREANDTKNSKSLAEVYEEEYLKQTQDDTFKGEKDEALIKDHDEIKQLFNGLTQALDALSNAYFTPKAPVLEVKVLPKLDVPAISMEEVIPANVSDAKLVTPKEVYTAKIKKSREEMDSQDRKRDRAAFKAQQKKLRVLKEMARKDAEATKTTSRKRLSDDQAEKNKALEDLMGQQNVTIISDKSNKQKLESKKGIKASVIQKGGKVEQETKRAKTEHIKL